jgi:hypothetical protein
LSWLRLLRFGSCFGLRDRFFETLEFFRRDFAVTEEGEHEALAGVVEEAVEDVAYFRAAGVVFSDTGVVEEGPTFLTVFDIAFLFEDSDGGEHGGIGQRG